MLLTYKVRHNINLTDMILKVKNVANFVIKTKCKSSKDVKQFGLLADISNQIIRKYGFNKKIKKIHNVNLTIPGKCTVLTKNI